MDYGYDAAARLIYINQPGTSDCNGPNCDPSVDPNVSYSPNGDLYQQTMTYNGLDIEEIEMLNDCNLNNIRNRYAYDKLHRVTSQTNLAFAGGSGVVNTSYSYFLNGDIETVTRHAPQGKNP